MKMGRVLRTLFTRADPVKDQIVEHNRQLTRLNVAASQRLTDTIDAFLMRNDQLTLRRSNAPNRKT